MERETYLNNIFEAKEAPEFGSSLFVSFSNLRINFYFFKTKFN